MNKLAVCAVLKNEARYLSEWLNFHLLVGVEHFYLYDNGSTDDPYRVLEPYEREGIVTFRDAPGKAMQLSTYERCLLEHEDDARWIAFIDIDEFLFSPTGLLLPEVLRSFDSYAQVSVNWRCFGTSNHPEQPTELVIESYVMRAKKDDGRNMHVKSIVQPLRLEPVTPRDPHHFIVRPDESSVTDSLEAIEGPFSTYVSWGSLVVNHYLSKSIADAKHKALIARADNAALRNVSDMLDPALNEEPDKEILAYVPLLKRRLRGF